VFEAIRKAGVKLAVVSNFDTRLRPLLRALNCDHWFDAVAVSAEVRKSHTQRHALSYSHFLSL
jgi:FMN phosphatase YigB (HAD superfamily)